MKYWLMKSEPESFSIDDLKNAKNSTSCWDGVRNYQARNFMRDDMQPGDRVLFYHSNCAEPAVAGAAEVAGTPYPDHTAFDPSSKYYDPKSAPENPTWVMVDIKYTQKFKVPVTLRRIRAEEALKDMLLVRKGMRLSIQPVTENEYKTVLGLAAQAEREDDDYSFKRPEVSGHRL